MPSVLHDLRILLSQDAAIPALRTLVFLVGLLAALAWMSRRSRTAVAIMTLAGCVGLGAWLVQIALPLGLGGSDRLGRQWAQAGVNASAEPSGFGFVLGTKAEFSLAAALATVGVPVPALFALPQVVPMMFLCLLPVVGACFIGNRRTAHFWAAAAVGGGLWPAVSPYSALLLRPSLLIGAGGLALAVAVVVMRSAGLRGRLHRLRFGLAVGMIAGAALSRALYRGESAGVDAFLLLTASLILASPLRAMVRMSCASRRDVLRFEALMLLAAIGGSSLLWWAPTQTVPGFRAARDPATALLRPFVWIAANVPRNSVVLASPSYSTTIAALGQRRVIFQPSDHQSAAFLLDEPARRERLLGSALQGHPVARLAEAFSVTHLFVGPGQMKQEEVPDDDLERLRLDLVYQDPEGFRIFRLLKK